MMMSSSLATATLFIRTWASSYPSVCHLAPKRKKVEATVQPATG
jgi:hypothetical protein